MPLSITILDEYSAGHATIGVADIGRQVFVAQILPLGLGMLTRRVFPNVAERLSNRLDRLCSIMFLALALLVLVSAWSAVVGSGTRVVLAVAVITVLALAAGHALGGPMPGTRTAVAVCSAARNPGLALLVATLNDAQPAIVAAIVTYLVVSSLTTLGYALWRRRTAAGPALVQRQ